VFHPAKLVNTHCNQKKIWCSHIILPLLCDPARMTDAWRSNGSIRPGVGSALASSSTSSDLGHVAHYIFVHHSPHIRSCTWDPKLLSPKCVFWQQLHGVACMILVASMGSCVFSTCAYSSPPIELFGQEHKTHVNTRKPILFVAAQLDNFFEFYCFVYIDLL
jgi:hypothetical protein